MRVRAPTTHRSHKRLRLLLPASCLLPPPAPARAPPWLPSSYLAGLRDYVEFVAPLPSAFSLFAPGASQTSVEAAADMYRIVVSERPHFFSRLIDLSWLASPTIRTASFVV